jgi:hypothetical protein
MSATWQRALGTSTSPMPWQRSIPMPGVTGLGTTCSLRPSARLLRARASNGAIMWHPWSYHERSKRLCGGRGLPKPPVALRSGIVLPRICGKPGWVCTPSNFYSATAPARRPPGLSTSLGGPGPRSTARSICWGWRKVCPAAPRSAAMPATVGCPHGGDSRQPGAARPAW